MGIRLFEVPMRREISPLHDAIAFARIAHIIWREQFDLVHAHSSKAGFLGRIAATCARVPAIVYSPHSFAFQYCPYSLASGFYRVLERFGSLFHHHLLCVSNGEKELATRCCISPPNRIHVIPNAIDSKVSCLHESIQDLKKELLIPLDVPVVGMVAHFRPQKAIGCFIRAIPHVISKIPETRFLIIGDGPLLGAMRRNVNSLGIEKNVILAGYKRDVSIYYQMMDVFALSSLWEGMPYAILEAMAAGLPVIATTTVGNDELVIPGKNGLLVRPNNSEEIAECICLLLEDDLLRQKFGLESLRLSKRRRSIDSWIQEYEAFYLGLLKPNRHIWKGSNHC